MSHDKQLAVQDALSRLDAQLMDVSAKVEALSKRKAPRGGGIPWTLLLLVGGGVYAWRTPAVRDQLQGLLKRLDPGPEGNLTRAADAAKGAVDDVMHGKSPADTAGRATGELGRAAEKTATTVQDDLKRNI